MRILLVEPDFPTVSKSKNHAHFLPIGLLKLARFHIDEGNVICIVRGNIESQNIEFESKYRKKIRNCAPDEILITSYFTYWSRYVKEAVEHYKNIYPKARVVVGGIYASLMPEHCKKYTKCDDVYRGVHEESDKLKPFYSYFERKFGSLDYQIIHTSRGCIRNCEFCGVYHIEPKFKSKRSIKNEIFKRKLVFYDNNLLANPYIEDILRELAELKQKGKIKWCDSQSGIDRRILAEKPYLAKLMKGAGFKNIRLSWDGALSEFKEIEKQIKTLKEAGFNPNTEIFVFMLYNWDISYEEMEKKRIKCWELRVQIADCRYRPINQTFDNYSPYRWKTGQTSKDYYIHKKGGWSDKKIRIFRKHIRQQNICVRYRLCFYSNTIERQYIAKKYCREVLNLARNHHMNEIEPILNKMKIDYWFPENYNGNGHYYSKEQLKQYYAKVTGKMAINKRGYSNTFKKWLKKQVSNELGFIK